MALFRTISLFALAAVALAQVLPLTITTASLPYGTAGTSYAAQLTISGGAGTTIWSIAKGSLPMGLSLDQKGVISGIPVTGGTSAFTVMVLDPETQQTATKDLFIGIPQITTAPTLPSAAVGVPYSVTFNASDGPPPYTWFVDAPPAGLVLDPRQGTLSGSPVQTGTYTFTITALGSSASKSSASKVFSLAVGSSPTIVTSSPLPNGDAGSSYRTVLNANGGTPPYRWSVAGSLPHGLSIDASTGTISGAPAAAGSYNFTVQVSDSAGASSTKPFSLNINPPLTITTTPLLPNGTVGVNYSRTILASGGMTPYSFSIGPTTPFGQSALPAGIALIPNGLIGGVPSTAGTYNFSIVVTDAFGAQTNLPFALTITAALAFQTGSPLTGGITGSPYSQSVAATGGSPPYSFALVGLPPPGLTFTPVGLLSGTPSVTGTFPFGVAVTDSSQITANSQFQITITSQIPPLQASPSSLSFAGSVGGDSPALQSLMIPGTAGAPSSFTVQVDGGTANSAAPRWLMVSPTSGTTPTRLVVTVDPGTMPAGTYIARIRILPSNTSLLPIDVPVTLTLTATAPRLDVIPNFIRLTARVQAPDTLEHAIVIRNSGGGGPISFTSSVVGRSAWITDLSRTSGQTLQNSPIFLRVHVDTTGLAVGSYRDVIHIASAAGNEDVPISLFISGSGAILRLHITGVRFHVKQGSGTTETETVNVLNHGDPASTSNWTADLLSGSEWLAFESNTGTSTFANPGTLTMLPKAISATFAPGAYYALVRVRDPLALGSPQYLTAVLEVVGPQTLAILEPGRAGVFFTVAANGRVPANEGFRVFTSNTEPVPFQVSTDTSDGAKWLSATAPTAQASTLSPGLVAVTVNPAGLPSGTYMGHVNIAYPGSFRAVNVTLVVTPAASPSPSAIRAADGCTPSRLAITQTGLPDSFAVPAKWPANLAVQLYDQCASPVLNGSVVAGFSNGDPPLTLHDLQNGTYSATWQPGNTASQMTITIRAAAGVLEPATTQLLGGISQNRAPVLAKNGIVNALNRVTGGAVAPATIVEVYGSDLASLTTTPNALPLPIASNGSFFVVGPVQTPLYFLSNGQLDAQIPAELTPNRQYTAVVSANGTLTLPEAIDLVTIQPGVAAIADGHVIAQHGADFSLVDSAHPAKPGELLVIYLSGMGATIPSVPSGSPSPSVEPLARLFPTPVVQVGGEDAPVIFAGLTPGLVGLYQINLRVPANLKPGDLDLLIKHGGVSSNATKLQVGQ